MLEGADILIRVHDLEGTQFLPLGDEGLHAPSGMIGGRSGLYVLSPCSFDLDLETLSERDGLFDKLGDPLSVEVDVRERREEGLADEGAGRRLVDADLTSFEHHLGEAL